VRQILVIALNTFREAIRNRIFASIVAFAVGLLALTLAISAASLHEEVRLMKDVGLFLVSTFSAFLCVFVGANLVYKDIERKTIYTILPKPIHRWQFLLGKYLGVAAMMAVQVTIMGTALASQFWLLEESFSWVMVQAIWLIYVEVLVVSAVALLFSSFSTPFLSGMLTLGLFAVGRFADRLAEVRLKADPGEDQAVLDLASAAARGLSLLAPDLSLYNVTPYVVYDTVLPEGFVAQATTSGVLYAALALGLAALLFSRRDFI
jgi:ABC-type transport system involved in multi-copper enzyme maturation permease subunit